MKEQPQPKSDKLVEKDLEALTVRDKDGNIISPVGDGKVKESDKKKG